MGANAVTPVIPDRTGTINTPNTSSTGTVAGPATFTGETPSGTWVTVPNNGATVLRIVWTVADTFTVTFPGGGPDGTTPTKTVTLSGSSGDILLGPFPVSQYGSTITAGAGLATTKVSAVATIPAY